MTDKGEVTAGPEPSSSVKSAVRTVELLEVLAGSQSSMGLAELQKRLLYPKSSLLVLLRTLLGRGWVQSDDSGRYSIGLRALLAGSSYLERDLVAQFSGPLLRRLEHDLDETVHVARLDAGDVVYLASRESSHHLRTTSRVGRRLPAYACALGKALLAERSAEVVSTLLPEVMEPRTPLTIVDRGTLSEELERTRARGYAQEAGENTIGLSCIAVVIPYGGVPQDAISCSIPSDRLTPELEQRVIRALQAAASELAELVALAAGSYAPPAANRSAS